MQVKIKKINPNAITPSYARTGDAGLDLTAITKEWDESSGCVKMGTGIAIEIPEGYCGLLFPRSSIVKQPLMLKNSVGVIDSGYRGELCFYFNPMERPTKNYNIGDRVGQLVIMPYPRIDVVVADSLSSTERGEGSTGSTGV